MDHLFEDANLYCEGIEEYNNVYTTVQILWQASIQSSFSEKCPPHQQWELSGHVGKSRTTRSFCPAANHEDYTLSRLGQK